MKKRFWMCIILCLVCLNSIAASLYAGVPCLDNGSGFISFPPRIDAMVWGGLALIFAIPALYFWWRDRPGLPSVPRALAFPVSYLAALALLTLLILLMGLFGLVVPFRRFHLPILAYVGLLAVLYPVLGFLGGKWAGPLKTHDLIWAAAITAVLGLMGLTLLSWASVSDVTLAAESLPGEMVMAMNTQTMMGDSWLGGLLGRVNLPACLLLDTYAYDIPSESWACPRSPLTELVCLVPPVLYALGWLAGCTSSRKAV